MLKAFLLVVNNWFYTYLRHVCMVYLQLLKPPVAVFSTSMHYLLGLNSTGIDAANLRLASVARADTVTQPLPQ